MTRSVSSTPEALVREGRFAFGTYGAPIAHVNPLDADIEPGIPVPRVLKALRLKEWQAVQFGNERWFAIVALFNAKALALVQVKLYDRERQHKALFEKKVAPWALRLPTTMLDSEVGYRSSDCTVRMRNLLRDGQVELHLDIAASGTLPRIRGALTGRAAGWEPTVVCMPFAANRGMYSHKSLMPGEGVLEVGSEVLELASPTGYLVVDDHKGYYPYVMKWDWVTGAGCDEAGRLVGFNLTRNQCTDPERFNENCLWVDGRRHLLGAVQFERRRDPEQWIVRDRAGRVDVTFEVECEGRVDINALVMRSKYSGPFGRFCGHIVDDDGQPVALDGTFGMGEDFYLRC